MKSVKLQGAFAEIDTQADVRAIETLSGPGNARDRMAGEIAAASGDYSPAVFFSLAAHHASAGRMPVALFWMFAGRIRLWYDVQRSTDKSVEAAVDLLNNGLPELLRLSQFEDIEASTKIMNDAADWDKSTPHNYDACWIALHGLAAFLPDAASRTRESLTIPESEWEALAESNRTEYCKNYAAELAGFGADKILQIRERIAELRSRE